MNLVLLDDDVYFHLLARTERLGETPSEILRRLLDIGVPPERVVRRKRLEAALRRIDAPHHEMTIPIRKAPWLPFDVERYIYLLYCVHERQGFDFVKVLKLRGRSRRYFAMSASEIEASGRGTQPRPLRDTGYWVLTNLPTREKERLLRNVMSMFRYSEPAMLAARDFLRRGLPAEKFL